MTVELTYRCSGCDAVVHGIEPMRKEFVSISGKPYGFGSPRWVRNPDDLAPQGWMAADPYTYATYCPECWRRIEDGEPAP